MDFSMSHLFDMDSCITVLVITAKISCFEVGSSPSTLTTKFNWACTENTSDVFLKQKVTAESVRLSVFYQGPLAVNT